MRCVRAYYNRFLRNVRDKVRSEVFNKMFGRILQASVFKNASQCGRPTSTGCCGSKARSVCVQSFMVQNLGNSTFVVGVRGELAGQASPAALVLNSTLLTGPGGVNVSKMASVAARVRALNYYGVHQLDVDTGSAADVLLLQSMGAAKARLGLHDGDDSLLVSSTAHKYNVFDAAKGTYAPTKTAAQIDGGAWPWLDGDLNSLRGDIVVEFGCGHHRFDLVDLNDTIANSDVRMVGNGRGCAGVHSPVLIYTCHNDYIPLYSCTLARITAFPCNCTYVSPCISARVTGSWLTCAGGALTACDAKLGLSGAFGGTLALQLGSLKSTPAAQLAGACTSSDFQRYASPGFPPPPLYSDRTMPG